MKRIVSLVMVMAALLGLMLIPASAADITGSVTNTWYYGSGAIPSTSKSLTVTFPLSLGDQSQISANSSKYQTLSISELDTGAGSLGASGSVGFYYSFYFSRSQYTTFSSVGSGLGSSSWLGYWYDQDGVQHSMDSLSVSTSSGPDNSSSSVFRVSSKVSVPDGSHLTRLHLMRPDYSTSYLKAAVTSGSAGTYLYVSSASVVATEVAADLVALEGIADEIAQTNEALDALYGDVMTVLNNMYTRMGDMLAVEQAANTYLSQIVSYLQGIDADTGAILTLLQTYLHYMAEIASTADDILVELDSFHVSFQNRMDLLMSNLALEFSSTRDAIYGAIDILINYLDSTFASAINPDLGQADSDLNAGIDNNHAIEQEWTGSLATDWESLQLDQYNFDSDYTNAFMVVSLWFSNIFNAFGAFGSVLMFPMVVGICMLILGVFRMGFSRTYSGRNQSKGGGSGA